MADTKEGLRSNPLIEEIRNLGKNLVPISGYLQKDEAKDTWRLYRSLAFDEYLRFGKDVVEFVFQVSKDHQKQGDPEALEPAIVWFGGATEVDRVQTFLVGDLATLYLPHADLAASLGETGLVEALLAGSVHGGCSTKPNCGCGEKPNKGGKAKT